MNNQYEVRIFRLDGTWSDWMEANSHEAIDKLFGNNRYVNVITYEYRDGSKIEYRRK